MTAVIVALFKAFTGFFRAAQSAGRKTKIANVHFVSIPSPQQTPNAMDHLRSKKSRALMRAHIESATIAVSQYSIMVSRDSQIRNGMKFTMIAANAAASGSKRDRAIP